VDINCPRCGSSKVVRVGQYGKFIGWLFGGIAVLIVAGFVTGLPLWFFAPFWGLFALGTYIKNPLLECDSCHLEWDPKKPPVIEKKKSGSSAKKSGKHAKR